VKRLLLLALLATSAAATPLTLRVALPAGVSPPAGARVVLRRVDTPAPQVERALQAPEILVDVPSGTWSINVDAAGIWHERQYATLPGAVAVDVPLWPSTMIAGEVALADSNAVPDSVKIRFAVAGGPTSDVTCSIVARRFACAIPAGTADLALRVRGHVTRYIWSTPLARGVTRDLGRIVFLRGATLVGRVEPPRRTKLDLDKITVTAMPSRLEGGQLSSLSTHPNARGFFHLDGIAPGEYKIAAGALKPRVSSAAIEVKIIDGAEATLSQPLILSAPQPLTVSVDPPLDPSLKQWRIQIDLQHTPRDYEPAADALLAPNGTYRSQLLHAGRYWIRIGSQDTSVWHSEELDVDEQTQNVFVQLHPDRVRGTVRLGDKPVAATIWFGGQRAIPRAELRSDDSGEFHGFVPHQDSDKWAVTVQSDAPMARRHFKNVRLHRGDDGELEADLRMDVTLLQGDVVDDKGAPAGIAMLNITSEKDGELTQPNTNADGSFAVYGLPPGRYQIVANAYMRQSKPLDIEIRAGEETPLLRIALLPNRQLKGIVKSAVGPVAGASVTAWSTDVPADMVSSFTTNEAGAFAAIIPPAAEQLDVMIEPPSFALKLFHIRWENRLLAVTVLQNGGTLTVEGIAPLDAIIQHGGATFPLMPLTYWQGSSSNGNRTTIGMLEPGNYTVCRASDRSACASGYLPPFGTLELEVKSRAIAAH
jgi:hypothetical protein